MNEVLNPNGDTFPIRTDVDPGYLQSALTKDITTLECIFDLIDNCIDAARDTMLDNPGTTFDRYGLPASYQGYSISLHFGSDWIAIFDNALGIDENTLANRTLRPGTESAHKFGIGRFGIGLKRALMKLGKRYHISTDTGQQASRVEFRREQLGGEQLLGQRKRSRGKAKTLIFLSELESMVTHEISSTNWKETALKELSRRYGLFASKGLAIFVNGARVPPFGPGIRDTGPVSHQTEADEIDGVRIFVDAGMHADYRISDEGDYDKSVNKNLTDQYGWYFVCNDRIVEVATHRKSLGWTATWHQEYYGFVGWVRFVSEDLSGNGDLPWDTKKTSVNPYSPKFLRIASKLQTFAENYKRENKAARPKENGTPPATSNLNRQKPPTTQSPTTEKSQRPSKPPPTKPRPTSAASKPNPDDHNENWTTLFPPVGVTYNHDKLKALVYEATQLELSRPYAATMLFRAIVENAIFLYVKRAGKYMAVKKSVFDEQEEEGRPFTDEQKKAYAPSLSVIVVWMLSHSEIFPDEYRRDCLASLQNFKKYLPGIQKVVHEAALTNSGKIRDIRDDCWTVIKYILENDPGKRNSG
jgi:hypothetical protein